MEKLTNYSLLVSGLSTFMNSDNLRKNLLQNTDSYRLLGSKTNENIFIINNTHLPKMQMMRLMETFKIKAGI